ncbi:MAG: arylsulfatase [Rubripirellula sp.]
MKSLLKYSLVAVFAVAIVALPGKARLIAAEASRPNIIIIMPDDQGYGDHGVTGNEVFRTPNIDALANGSASMSDFYVCPVCSPTRASLMTGRYHYRTRVVDTFKGRSMMDSEEVTIAELLRDAGYATGIFGKWHLGDNFPLRPMDQGFEESFIHKGGGLAQPSEPLENDRRYTDPILFRNGEQVQTNGYCTDLYFDAAMEFIDECKEQEKPFFIYLPPNAPHGPFHDVPEELYQYYKSRDDLASLIKGKRGQLDQLARIAAMVDNIDQNVGRLDQHLKQNGLFENTLVFFLVDNGPNSSRYVGPFRGMKTNVHEGGIRSPLFVRWPARLKPGATSDRISAHIDVLPTILEAAGVDAPDQVQVDGRSLLPLLEEREFAWPDRNLVFQVHRGDSPIPFHHFALRNQNWKLVHPTGFSKSQMPDDVPFELYDMTTDQGESQNLAETNPERLAELQKAYEAWFDDVSHTRPDNFAPPRIVIGADAEPVSSLSPQDWRVSDDSGWGSGGRWLVHVDRAATFDAEIVYREPIGETEVVLQIGDVRKRGDLPAKQSRIELKSIDLPAGDTAVQVKSLVDGKQRDPYHVILTRVD